MTRDEIQDIHENIRRAVDALSEYDKMETWSKADTKEVMLLLSELDHYNSREKSYYRQYRGIMRD